MALIRFQLLGQRQYTPVLVYLHRTGLVFPLPHAVLRLVPPLSAALPGRETTLFAALRPTAVAASAAATKRQRHVVKPSV